MHYLRPSKIWPLLFPKFIWSVGDNASKGICLSFDDGPTPGVTDIVLKILSEACVPAVFFMTGQAVEKNSSLAKEVRQAGHEIGSHSYSHPDAWKTRPEKWNQDIQKGQDTIAQILGEEPVWFRPPYGHFIPGLNQVPVHTGMVMWQFMPGDFDTRVQASDILSRYKENIQSGDIVVFHDSLKSKDRIIHSLPSILEWSRQARYEFLTLNSIHNSQNKKSY
jgi:peptidoglycan/xylan/chitin deacetylase (PgdA/CDA1 family)